MFSSIPPTSSPEKPPPAAKLDPGTENPPASQPASTASAHAPAYPPASTDTPLSIPSVNPQSQTIPPPKMSISIPPLQQQLPPLASEPPPDSPSYFSHRAYPPPTTTVPPGSSVALAGPAPITTPSAYGHATSHYPPNNQPTSQIAPTTPTSVPAIPSVSSVASSSYSFMNNPPLMTASLPLQGPPLAMVAAAAAAASSVTAASISSSVALTSIPSTSASNAPSKSSSALPSPAVARANTLPVYSSNVHFDFPGQTPTIRTPGGTTATAHTSAALPYTNPQHYPSGSYIVPPVPASTSTTPNVPSPFIPPLSYHKFRSPSLPANSLLDQNTDLSSSLNSLTYTDLQNMLNPDLSPSSSNTPSNNNKKTLIVDVRPYTQYSKSRIKSAINICIPSTLLKRSTFPLSRFGECMVPSQRTCIDNLGMYSSIVIYDQSTEKVSTTIYSPIVYTILKFSQSKSLKGKLYYLHGGISLVQEKYPDLIEDNVIEFSDMAAQGQNQRTAPPNSLFLSSENNNNNPSNNNTSSANTTQTFNFPPVLTGFSLPLSSIKDGPIKPFASNINGGRENENFSDYDLSPLKLPADMSSTEINTYFPSWLRDIIQSDSGTQKIARRFNHIEEAQKARLQSAFSQGFKKPSDTSPRLPTSSTSSSGSITQITDDVSTASIYNNNKVTSINTPIESIAPKNFISSSSSTQINPQHVHLNYPVTKVDSLLVHNDSNNQTHISETTDDCCEPVTPDELQVRYSFSAGVELGAKNRYTNIWPYDHTRVRLPEVLPEDEKSYSDNDVSDTITKDASDENLSNSNEYSSLQNQSLQPNPVPKIRGLSPAIEDNSTSDVASSNNGSDYFNASYISPHGSLNRYIATQGPLPDTFNDFWNVVWDKKIPLIIMLTAEVEGGQIKCHRYWEDGIYGSSTPIDGASGTGHQLKLTLISTHEQKLSKNTGNSVIVRRFRLINKGPVSTDPAGTPRSHTIVQLQYTSWPDLGSPATPEDLIELCSLKDRYLKELVGQNSTSIGASLSPPQNISKNKSPLPWVLVHCSAGCGRTGTFCTVDSVIDILREYGMSSLPKRQIRLTRQTSGGSTSLQVSSAISQSSDGPDSGSLGESSSPQPLATKQVDFESYDLVYRTVHDFRRQRLSMVQVLRQYVLCYETVIMWIHQQYLRENGNPALSLSPNSATSLTDDKVPKTAIGTTCTSSDSITGNDLLSPTIKTRRHYSTPAVVLSPIAKDAQTRNIVNGTTNRVMSPVIVNGNGGTPPAAISYAGGSRSSSVGSLLPTTPVRESLLVNTHKQQHHPIVDGSNGSHVHLK